MLQIFISCFHSAKEVVKEADSAILPDIPPKQENMANNNNNRYVWSDKEIKVFRDLIQRTLQ